MSQKLEIDNKTIIRVLAVAVAFFLGLQLLSELQHALTLIAIAIFLALALNLPVSYLASRITRGSRIAATGIAYVMVIAVIAGFLWILVPPLFRQTGDFLNNLPQYLEDISSGDNFVADFVQQYDLDQEINDFGSSIADRLGDTSGPIFSGIRNIGSAMISILTVLVLTFFMLIEGPEWIRRIWDSLPEKNKKHRQDLAKQMYTVITNYVNGQLLVALLASLSSLIVMLLLGIPFALPLAGLVGLFGLIPMVGALMGSVLVVTVALLQSPGTAIIMTIFFIIYQQIENNLFQPYIQSKTLDVSPLMVLVAVIIGFGLGGILGGFIAIPAAAITKILWLDYNDHRKDRRKA